MKLSAAERQTLLGPLVVGCVVGAFVAYAAYALNSEFMLQGMPLTEWQLVAESVLGFILSVAFTVGILGVLPVLVHRKRSAKQRVQ